MLTCRCLEVSEREEFEYSGQKLGGGKGRKVCSNIYKVIDQAFPNEDVLPSVPPLWLGLFNNEINYTVLNRDVSPHS
jgi:hypothetical protein